MTGQHENYMNEYFETIYKDTNKKVQIYLISKCKNFSDINDIMQEVYLELYNIICRKGTDYIKNEESFVINLCKKKIYSYYSFWERIKNITYFEEKENPDILMQEYDDESESAEDTFFRKEMVSEVQDILRKKPDDIQKIFYMYYSLDMRLAEIADTLGMNVQTVKSRLHRTRLDIKNTLSMM